MALGIIIGVIITIGIEALVLVTFEAIFDIHNISLTTNSYRVSRYTPKYSDYSYKKEITETENQNNDNAKEE